MENFFLGHFVKHLLKSNMLFLVQQFPIRNDLPLVSQVWG